MNITLSAGKELVEKSRIYARKRNSTLNQLIRDYLEAITADKNDNPMEEAVKLMQQGQGRTPEGYRFNREEAHAR